MLRRSASPKRGAESWVFLRPFLITREAKNFKKIKPTSWGCFFKHVLKGTFWGQAKSIPYGTAVDGCARFLAMNFGISGPQFSGSLLLTTITRDSVRNFSTWYLVTPYTTNPCPPLAPWLHGRQGLKSRHAPTRDLFFDLLCKQKVGVKTFLVKNCEVGKECRPFLDVNFGRDFFLFGGGGGVETLEKQGRKTCGKHSLKNSLRDSPHFPKCARPKQNMQPKSALQNLGINVFGGRNPRALSQCSNAKRLWTTRLWSNSAKDTNRTQWQDTEEGAYPDTIRAFRRARLKEALA